MTDAPKMTMAERLARDAFDERIINMNLPVFVPDDEPGVPLARIEGAFEAIRKSLRSRKRKGRQMKTSPTARSMKYLREHGFLVAKVEKWNKFAGVRQDVWGFGDLLVCCEGWGTALVQVTSTSNLSTREKKARDLPALWLWLRAGNRFILHGWAKKGPRGTRKKWTLTEIEIRSGQQ